MVDTNRPRPPFGTFLSDNSTKDGRSYFEYQRLLMSKKVALLQEKKERPLYICGHSLGGAMATICATRYLEAKELYTYGSPRVFNKERVLRLHVPHKRHVNNNDAVPRVPLWLMGFRHQGRFASYYRQVFGELPSECILFTSL